MTFHLPSDGGRLRLDKTLTQFKYNFQKVHFFISDCTFFYKFARKFLKLEIG